MNKHSFLIVAALLSWSTAAANEVTRGGLSITVPEGDWRRGVGTCTGESYWYRDEITFSVAARRYLAKDAETLSSGDIYTIYSFGDVQSEVISMMEQFGGKVRNTETLMAEAGAKILVMEFEWVSDDEGSNVGHVSFAFREAADRLSVVEIRCSYSPEQTLLGQQLFRAALESLMKGAPNQALQTTPIPPNELDESS